MQDVIKLNRARDQIKQFGHFYTIQIKNNTNTNFSRTIDSHAKQLASDLDVLFTCS